MERPCFGLTNVKQGKDDKLSAASARCTVVPGPMGKGAKDTGTLNTNLQNSY